MNDYPAYPQGLAGIMNDYPAYPQGLACDYPDKSVFLRKWRKFTKYSYLIDHDHRS